ncbi:hypothetical protein GCM10020256_09470 [Streptomyces thermocoprophilus]
MVLHGDLEGLGGVAEGVLAGEVVSGDEDDGDAVLGDDVCVEQALAGADVVEPDAGDLVGEVGVGEDAFLAAPAW